MDTRLNYDRRGHGEPLLLIHPVGADWHIWEPVLGQLAQRHDVIAIDLPGHGQSPSLDPGMSSSPSAIAELLADFIKQLGLETVHIVGNSLGGWIALEFAKLGRARSVVAIAPAGLWRD